MHEFPSVSANYRAPDLCDTLRPPDGQDTRMEAAHYTVTSVEPYVLSSEVDINLRDEIVLQYISHELRAV